MTRVTLRHEGVEVVVAPTAGGRVASAVLAGVERLVTAPPSDLPRQDARMLWGAYPMVPWAGRIAGARVSFDGQAHDVPAVGGHGLHGVGHDASWAIESRTREQLVMTCDLGAAGWPFGGTARHAIEVGGDHVDFELTVEAGARSMPVWCGWHPCFARPVDGDMAVRVRADGVLATQQMIPTGEVLTIDGDHDLVAGLPLDGRRLDDCYVRPASPVGVRWPDLDLDIAFGARTNALVVYTPAGSVCVEPQTAWPDALRLAQAGVAATGVTRLDPGGSMSTTMRWTWGTGGDT